MTFRLGGAALTRPLPLEHGAGLGPATSFPFPLASTSCRLNNWLYCTSSTHMIYDLEDIISFSGHPRARNGISFPAELFRVTMDFYQSPTLRA